MTLSGAQASGRGMNEQAQKMWEAAHGVTFRTMREALQAPASVDDLLNAVEFGQAQLDDALSRTRQAMDVPIACAAGCSWCCWLRIDVRAHEVLVLARSLRRMHGAEALAALQQQAAERAADPARSAPCLLLGAQGQCTVYAARPSACRRYFSRSVDACRTVWEGNEPTEGFDYHFLTEMGRWTASGTHNALIAEGYDGYLYRLDAALAEALADPVCESRWFAKLKVFSHEAESPFPGGLSQEEAIARVRARLRNGGAESA